MDAGQTPLRRLASVLGVLVLLGTAGMGLQATQRVEAGACCCDISCMMWCEYPYNSCNPVYQPPFGSNCDEACCYCGPPPV